MINLLAVENSAHPKSEYFEKPDIDCKKFLRVKNIFAIEFFFETRKEKYWNRANMGFKTGMFKYFNELDEDCSGFLEPDEITSKLPSTR